MKKNQIIQIALLPIKEWRESRRRIYSIDGVAPTLHGIGMGGNTEPKILVEVKYDTQKNHSDRGA